MSNSAVTDALFDRGELPWAEVNSNYDDREDSARAAVVGTSKGE